MATPDMTADAGGAGQKPLTSLQARGRRLGVYLISPLVLTLTFIFAFPTFMIFYLAFSFWGPLDGVSWLHAFDSWNWFVNFGDAFRDATAKFFRMSIKFFGVVVADEGGNWATCAGQDTKKCTDRSADRDG